MSEACSLKYFQLRSLTLAVCTVCSNVQKVFKVRFDVTRPIILAFSSQSDDVSLIILSSVYRLLTCTERGTDDMAHDPSYFVFESRSCAVLLKRGLFLNFITSWSTS